MVNSCNSLLGAVVDALDDAAYELRILALQKIDLINKFSKKDAIRKIMQMANTDIKTLVQAEAINTLGKLTDLIITSPVLFIMLGIMLKLAR